VSGATESLGRRIAGAKDLSSVVRSMKALAASSIAQYERAIDALHGYTRTVESGLSVCLRELAPLEHLAAEPQCLARGAILFGSDQGLVGRFNESLVDFAVDTLKALPGATTELWSVGERMAELVAGSSLPPPTPLTVPHSVEAIAPLVSQMLIAITTARVQGQVGEIYVFHNRPSGDMGYEPISKRLLPLDEVWQRDILTRPWPTKALPEVLGSTRSTLEGLIRGHLFVALFQACAQSLASENASRLAAMQRAQDNIARILDGLSRTFHRLRQESIDEELFDVVSGYESLTRRGRVTEL
jgi:F-type H+-transporting ATPase subunit gamma